MPDRLDTDIQAAYRHCKEIAHGHYENFPVGSFLLPKALRPHFFALYAFMRTADDFADLPHRPTDERLALLADWRNLLDRVFEGKTVDDPVFVALRNTIQMFALTKNPFERLLEAFEFDARGAVNISTNEEFRWYTSCSAEPVGELVLALFGYRDAKRLAWSNEICTGLQLINFIQDLNEDITSNRRYFPVTDRQLFHIELAGDVSLSEDVRSLILFKTAQAKQMIETGSPLAESVRGRLRFELRAVLGGAQKIIRAIEESKGDVFTQKPRLTKRDTFFILAQSLSKG